MSWLYQAMVESEREKKKNTTCWFCNRKGHYKSECPDRLKEIKCHRCGNFGHYKNDCKAILCYHCKNYGHCMRDCPTRIKNK